MTKSLHYCILLFITFDFICNLTMFVQNGFWTLRATPTWHCSQRLHQNFECVPPVLIDRAIACKFPDSSLNGLGAIVWHYRRRYRRTDGRTRGIIISLLFSSSKSLGIIKREPRQINWISYLTFLLSSSAWVTLSFVVLKTSFVAWILILFVILPPNWSWRPDLEEEYTSGPDNRETKMNISLDPQSIN